MSEPPAIEKRLRGLMVASLAGDESAYRALLRELAMPLRRYFVRRLAPPPTHAEDLVQECLFAMHTRRHTYDLGRPFTAWVFAIARYKLVDHLRQRRITEPLADDDSLFGTDDESALTARLDVDGLLGAVPAATARLIRQVQIEGASIAEAARDAKLTEGAAKVRIHRGLKALAAMIGRRDDR